MAVAMEGGGVVHVGEEQSYGSTGLPHVVDSQRCILPFFDSARKRTAIGGLRSTGTTMFVP